MYAKDRLTMEQTVRKRLVPDQTRRLEEYFHQTNDKPNLPERELLAAELGIRERSVQIWYQNR